MAEEEDVTCDDVSETDDYVTTEDVPDGIPFLKHVRTSLCQFVLCLFAFIHLLLNILGFDDA